MKPYSFKIGYSLGFLQTFLSGLNRNSKLNMPFLRNEFSKTFEDLFYDDVICKDFSDVWSNEKFKIRAKNFYLMLVKFWNLLSIKCPSENYSNIRGSMCPIR